MGAASLSSTVVAVSTVAPVHYHPVTARPQFSYTYQVIALISWRVLTQKDRQITSQC